MKIKVNGGREMKSVYIKNLLGTLGYSNEHFLGTIQFKWMVLLPLNLIMLHLVIDI